MANFKITDLTNNILIKLPYSVIKLAGNRVVDFMQGQFSCDATKLTKDTSIYGCYANLKGKIRVIFRAFYQGDNIYLRLPTELSSSFIKELQQYAKFSRIEITETNIDCYGLIIADHLLINLPTEIFATTQQKYTLNKINDNRYELYITPDNFDPKFWQDITSSANFNTWQLFNIQECIPEITVATQDMFFPHSLNLPQLGAVAFNKGCYRGQEVIARMEYRGKPKRHMYTAKIAAGNLNAGQEILTSDQTIAGNIIIAANATPTSSYALIELHEKYITASNLTVTGATVLLETIK